MVGIILVYVETFCVIFLVKCEELAGLWAYVQNRNKKYIHGQKRYKNNLKMDKT